jgi:hypothetical protein
MGRARQANRAGIAAGMGPVSPGKSRPESSPGIGETPGRPRTTHSGAIRRGTIPGKRNRPHRAFRNSRQGLDLNGQAMKDKLTGKSLDRLLIAAILLAILSLSSYSLYTILRHYGAAPIAAASASAGLDFVAIFAARFSLKYAKKGLNGSFPRAVVILFAALGMVVQTLHARIGRQPLIMMVFWASLPMAAVITYEIYLRWTGRSALIRAGHVFPVAKPSYGLYTWLRRPAQTLSRFDSIMDKRADTITAHHLDRFEVAREQVKANVPERPVKPPAPRRPTKRQRAHAPVTDIRTWAQREGYIEPGQKHGRLSRRIHDAYAKAQAQEAAS